MSKQRRYNHPRIISVDVVRISAKNQRRYGWNVLYYAGAPVVREITTERTTNLKTGAPLKQPVKETRIEHSAGTVFKILKRRKSLRRLGVYV